MEQNKNKKFSLLRSRCAAGFAPGAVVVRPLGDIVLLCDGSRRDALASRVVPCRNKWTMRAKSLPPPPLLLLLLLLLPPSSLPAPTAVVRCVAESDVCARRSRTTAVKSAGVREAITSCPDFQNKTRHLIPPPPFKLCHIRFFRKVKAYLNSWCFVMRLSNESCATYTYKQLTNSTTNVDRRLLIDDAVRDPALVVPFMPFGVMTGTIELSLERLSWAKLRLAD
ncbi:hypothetical protein F2P81_013823 [Scophthalmus maximus]|uniref:Uncharacterized protein n=1 Tax=Scophthalmus maximus TaxID=52904 RepID=A0A6A4SKM3_SCOMX|nr:hypothetical protein F2P81_013823 [Scophthalmus maximus]